MRRLVVLCGVQFIDVLGVTSAITAIPPTLRDLHAPQSDAALLATAYAMCFGGLLVLGARLGDRYGHRRILLIGTLSFAAVGLIGASAQGIAQVIVARGLQGAAAAVSVPSALRLLLELPDRQKALAAWSATGAAAGATGLLVGGALTALLGWRAVFWINLPVGLALAAAIRAAVPTTTPQRTPLDLANAALLTTAVMAVIVGAALGQPLAALAGALLGAVYLRRNRLTGNLRTGTAISFVNTATTSSAGVLATLELQQRLHASSFEAGLALLPFSLAVIAGSALSGKANAAAGLAAIAAGNLTLALTGSHVAGILLGVAIAGTGLGIASVHATAIGTDTPDEGLAAGILNTGAQVGTALGVAALVLVADHTTPAAAWATAAAIAALSALRATASARPRARFARR